MQTIIGENGLMVELAPGEDITSANPGRPNAQFDPFVTAIIRQIGMRSPKLPNSRQTHQESYSAARAAMNDAWRFFRTRRDWMATYFCQPVYEAGSNTPSRQASSSRPGQPTPTPAAHGRRRVGRRRPRQP